MVRSLMCYWVLTSNGSVESGTTDQRVTDLELQTEEVKKKLLGYDEAVKDRFKGDFFWETSSHDNWECYLQNVPWSP